ncbi:MAG: putative quorum-sensing-regulated virulence factor [Planctomycetota bacterium]|jgi:hypothetical protein
MSATTEALATIDTPPAAEPVDWWDCITDADREYSLGPRKYPPKCFICGGRLHHSADCQKLRDEWAPRMPLGKHKGCKIHEMPRDYCRWLVQAGVRLRDADAIEAVEERAGLRYGPDGYAPQWPSRRRPPRPKEPPIVWFEAWAKYHRGGPLPPKATGPEGRRSVTVARVFEQILRGLQGI